MTTTSIPSVSVSYARNGSSTRANELGMRPMQERAYAKRGEQYLLIKSPPASGIVCALGQDGHGYVLEDASGRFSPIEWARRAVALYHKHSADRIVAEANQGGLMVETTVRTVDQNVSFRAVHASRGKITRAEPIAALSEQNRIHLVGAFPELEDQLCTFEAGSPRSPDRLDAMVWGFTELMVTANNCGFLDFCASMFGGSAREKFGAAVGEANDRTIKMLAPVGVGEAQLFGGRNVKIPADRIVDMTDDEAKWLYRAGWVRPPANT